MSDTMDYASAGVDIDLEGSAVASLIGALGRSVRTPGTPGAPVDLPGGFGGLLEFGDHLLAMATDGVGSKLQIASSLNAWGGVGIDCMAMNVNDLLCVGAEPMAFVDYIAVPTPDPEVHAAIGASLAEACRRARVTLAGGETASLPGIVTEVDLSGTALGYMGRNDAITGEHVQAGDVLIGLPASGIHSNGYSLVRRIMEHVGADLSAPAPFDAVVEERRIERFATQDGETPTLGEVLLNPTQIYVDPVIGLLNHLDAGHLGGRTSVRGLCHVTGGGLSNLLRLNAEVGWRIDSPLPVLPEFTWLQEVGGVETREMYRTFNMGMGMVLAVDAAHAKGLAAWLAERMPGSAVVGTVVEDEAPSVVHVPTGSTFSHY